MLDEAATEEKSCTGKQGIHEAHAGRNFLRELGGSGEGAC